MLKDYQKKAAEFIVKTPRCAVWAKMGMGKTAAVAEALKSFQDKSILVIAPLRVCLHVWPAELKEWAGIVSTVLAGKPAGGRKIIGRCIIINYELVPWLYRQGFKADIIVIDEASKLRGLRARGGAVNAGAIRDLCTKAERVIELTGTPTANNLQALWGQMFLLDGGLALGAGYQRFLDTFFYARPLNNRVNLYFPRAGAKEQAVAKVEHLIHLIPDDVIPVGAPNFTSIYTTIGNGEALYSKIEKEFVAEFEDGSKVVAANKSASLMKLWQCCNGFIYKDEEAMPVHLEKIKALEDLFEQNGEAPLLVAYWFKEDLAMIKHAFPFAKSLTDKDAIEGWNTGKIKMLLLHPASAGHGLNLQHGGNQLCFYSQCWDNELKLQTIERIGPRRQAQSGYNRPVFIYEILAKNKLDEIIYKSATNKTLSMEEIFVQLKNKNYMSADAL